MIRKSYVHLKCVVENVKEIDRLNTEIKVNLSECMNWTTNFPISKFINDEQNNQSAAPQLVELDLSRSFNQQNLNNEWERLAEAIWSSARSEDYLKD